MLPQAALCPRLSPHTHNRDTNHHLRTENEHHQCSDSGGLFSSTSKKDSRAVVPAFAEPDIHSLSQVPKDRHRRLSVCSLPILKQFGESFGSLISVAQSANGRTWQSARCGILFFAVGDFYAAALLRAPAGTNSRCPRSTASRYPTIFQATASVA